MKTLGVHNILWAYHYYMNYEKSLSKNLIEMTNKIQLCRIIYYSIVPCLLYMFRAILSLIIRSF